MILEYKKKWKDPCFSCVSNLQDCPQCRKPLYKLNCPTCESHIQQERFPLFLPDLPSILGFKHIPRLDITRAPLNPYWCFLYIFYSDTLQKVPIVIRWHFCYGVGHSLVVSNRGLYCSPNLSRQIRYQK